LKRPDPRNAALAILAAILTGWIVAAVVDRLWTPTFHLAMETFRPETVEVEWECGQELEERTSQRVSLWRAGREGASLPIPIDVRRARLAPQSGRGPVSLLELRVTRGYTLFRWTPENGFVGWGPAHQDQKVSVEADRLLITNHKGRPALSSSVIGDQLAGALRLQRILVGVPIGLLVVAAAAVLGLLRDSTRASLEAGGKPRERGRWGARLAVSLTVLVVFGTTARLLLPGSSGGETGSAYFDPEGAYDLSFLNDRGKRLSENHGPVGLLLDPFTFYRSYPSYESARFRIDENGFRGGIRAPSLPKVILVGGSTAFGFGLDSDDQTAAARLEEYLPGRCGIDAAVIGYLSGQELALMVHYLDRWRPEAYVAIDGWNDYAQHGTARRIIAVNGKFLNVSDDLQRFCEAEHGVDTEPWPFPPPPEPSGRRDRLLASLDAYVSNLEKMNTWAGGRGARFLVAFQPTVACRQSPTEEEGKIAFGEPQSTGYAEFVELALERCTRLGIECVDLAREPEFLTASETLFLDPVHLTAAGHDALARVLGRALR